MVHVEDPRGRWSVSASEVIRIMSEAEWRVAAIDVLAALGPPARSVGRRVLVMRGAGGRELALLAAGALAIADVDPASVLPLPIAVAAAVPQISAIIAASDTPLSLLIEPSAVISSSEHRGW